MDLPDAQAAWPEAERAITEFGLPVLSISAVTRENVETLLYRVQAMLDELPPQEDPFESELPEITPGEDESIFTIQRVDDETWRVHGIALERAAQMTNWDYYEAAMRFQRILRAMGVVEALREAGVEEGDTVQIDELELVWGYDNAFGE
jgi:GTP-binding protein